MPAHPNAKQPLMLSLSLAISVSCRSLSRGELVVGSIIERDAMAMAMGKGDDGDGEYVT